ncbi:MogA/MoaB family molybdenum cofactor biosynthesis protein [Salirhabdus salicampi]|uniref:MogA/MoaB family molybdenum cofactor biosynthesis protein n=1 Tax=Salirhabdus salicampi TaxID=476102 RepID=UPI0020C5895E|nr:MogA/MoaB family molybdenum cofactor biosynthesis protein [Salirhabdus salicampi]MCP8615644.1 MogA/MoaB family molybdenum cofactor biosynthesis protein [Salirhabdus salicampi]
MLKQHRKKSPRSVKCAVVTVSDTRDKETDKSGKLLHELLEKDHHKVHFYKIIPDEKSEIVQTLNETITHSDIECVIVNGGTGIAKRDVTIEAVEPILDKELPGFGELFRYLSYELDIGSASILSRAIAGVANNTAVFSIPGSSGAVKLAMEKLISPELGHIVMEINKDL